MAAADLPAADLSGRPLVICQIALPACDSRRTVIQSETKDLPIKAHGDTSAYEEIIRLRFAPLKMTAFAWSATKGQNRKGPLIARLRREEWIQKQSGVLAR